ncbi:hypothetical protein PHPALM_28602 [Phytophthora palmivora]|uniref:Uncharacterized protein n=1 Tax=Phytophthora palmivora TaxID=4796 RepID=A0A2P4X9N8_9STRA|nr:hypothetical protein PHPALM_28602 [Phytophthora palmivora]
MRILSLAQAARLLYAWCMRAPQVHAAEMADVSETTVSEYYAFLCALCSKQLRSDRFQNKRQRGRVYEDVWLFSGVDRSTGTLSNHLALPDLYYTDKYVNHTEYYVDPQTEIHIKRYIKSMRGMKKRTFEQRGRVHVEIVVFSSEGNDVSTHTRLMLKLPQKFLQKTNYLTSTGRVVVNGENGKVDDIGFSLNDAKSKELQSNVKTYFSKISNCPTFLKGHDARLIRGIMNSVDRSSLSEFNVPPDSFIMSRAETRDFNGTLSYFPASRSAKYARLLNQISYQCPDTD